MLIASTPRRSPSLRVEKAASPSASISSFADSTMRSRVSGWAGPRRSGRRAEAGRIFFTAGDYSGRTALDSLHCKATLAPATLRCKVHREPEMDTVDLIGLLPAVTYAVLAVTERL